MEQETLFTAVKWDILEVLSYGKKSPLEISKETNSSVSNISQSLRFLELGNLIKSERITNRDAGKPRVLYSLAKDSAYLIVTARGLVKKEKISLDERKKLFLRIWLFEYEKLHPFIEKAIQSIDLSDYELIALGKENLPSIELYLILKDGVSSKKTKTETCTMNKVSKKVSYITTNVESLQKDSENYYLLYDPMLKLKENLSEIDNIKE